jgi:hypothetical protein
MSNPFTRQTLEPCYSPHEGGGDAPRPSSVVVGVSVIGAPVQVLPVNAARHSICFASPTGNTIYMRPVGYNYTSVEQSFGANSSSGPTCLDRNMIGDLITQAWEVTNENGNVPFICVETNIR